MEKEKKKITAAAMAVLAYISEEGREREIIEEQTSAAGSWWAMSCRPGCKGLRGSFPWRFSRHPGRG